MPFSQPYCRTVPFTQRIKSTSNRGVLNQEPYAKSLLGCVNAVVFNKVAEICSRVALMWLFAALRDHLYLRVKRLTQCVVQHLAECCCVSVVVPL